MANLGKGWKIQDQQLAAMRWHLRDEMRKFGRKKARLRARFFINSLKQKPENKKYCEKLNKACIEVLRMDFLK